MGKERKEPFKDCIVTIGTSTKIAEKIADYTLSTKGNRFRFRANIGLLCKAEYTGLTDKIKETERARRECETCEIVIDNDVFGLSEKRNI